MNVEVINDLGHYHAETVIHVQLNVQAPNHVAEIRVAQLSSAIMLQHVPSNASVVLKHVVETREWWS